MSRIAQYVSAREYLRKHGLVRDNLTRVQPSSLNMKEVRAPWAILDDSECIERKCVSCGS